MKGSLHSIFIPQIKAENQICTYIKHFKHWNKGGGFVDLWQQTEENGQ